MFKINQPRKAKFRVGQKVVIPFYSTIVFKVTSKTHGLYGEVIYTLKSACGITQQADEKSLQKA
jgi:hypothetical protein